MLSRDSNDLGVMANATGSADAAAAMAGPARPGPRGPVRVAARAVGAVAGVALLALPIWLAVDAVHRPAVVRMAAAGAIAALAARILGAARRLVAEQPPSTLDRAARAAPVEPSIPREYRDLAEELHFARTSHGYWTRVLEPRLVALAGRLPGAGPIASPPRSLPRRLLGLGPRLGALRAAIARLEGR